MRRPTLAPSPLESECAGHHGPDHDAHGEEDLEQDIGEDQGEDGAGVGGLEDVRFVEAAELEAVKKEIEELHRANGALQSLI